MKAFQKNKGELRKKKEDEISKLKRFRSELIFQQLPIGAAIIDSTTGQFIQVNEKYCEITGYSISEMLATDFQSVTHPDDLQEDLDNMEKLRNGEFRLYRMVKRYIRKDCSVIWVDLTVVPLWEESEKPKFHLAAVIDINASKIAEQNLKESEELFRRVITNAPISIFATDEKGIFTLHEGKAIERLGMKSGENVGASAYDLFSDIKVIEHDRSVSTGKSILDRVSKGAYLSGVTELNGVVFDNQFAPIWDEDNKVAGLLGIATDITERKLAEEELRESETYNRMLFDQSVIGLALARMDGQFTDVNQAFAQIIGRTIDEILKLTYWDITPKKYAEQEKIQLHTLNTTGHFGPYEKEYIHKNGHLVPVRLQGVIIERKGEKYIWSSVEDISGRKQLEQERLAFERRYQLLFNEIDEGFCIIEMIFDENEKPIDYRFLEVNPAFAKQTGLVDAPGKRMRDLAPKHEEYWFEIYGKISVTGEPARFLYRAEQLHRWYDVYAFRFGQPEKRHVAILFNDITEHKQAEEKLQHSEHNLAEAERIGHTGSWEHDVATGTANWSDNMFRIFDVDPVMNKELVFKHFVDNVVHPDDRTLILSVFEDALAGKRPYDLEYRIIKRDGSIRTIHALAETVFDEKGKAIKMIGKVEDITGRKQMEKMIRESEERYRLMLENSMDAILFTAPDGTIFSANQAACKMFQRTEEEICRVGRAGLTDVDDPRLNKLINERKRDGKAKGEITLIRKDSTRFNTELSSSTFTDSNGNLRTSIIIRDITERKKTEAALRKSEDNLNEAQRLSKIGSWDWDVTTDTIRWSKESYRIYGFDPQKAPTGYEQHLKVYTPKSIKDLNNAVKNSMQTGASYDLDLELASTSNTRWIKARGEVKLDEVGKFIGLSGTAQDITLQKQMELAVEENKYFLRNVLDTNPNIIFVINKDGKIILANKAFAGFYSTTVENIEGKTQEEIHKKHHLPTEELDRWLAENLQVINSGLPHILIEYSLNRDGYATWYRTRKFPIKLSLDEKAVLVVSEDITDLKQTEENRRLLAEITLHISEGISLVRENDGIIVFTNRRFEEMFGYSTGELIGKHVKVLNASTSSQTASDSAQNIIESIQNNDRWKGEVYNVKKDGTMFWTKASITKFDHPEYGPVLLTLQMDIDQRKQIERKLIEHEHELQQLSTELINAQEKERKILSQELHDEVGQSLTALKINLASISKKLPLDHDSKTKNRLQEMNEILENLISQVHEISLNLRPSLLDVLGLMPTIKSYCNQFSKRTGINVRIANEINVKLDLEQEIHLFRIVQETLTNVVKHANAKNIFLILNLSDNVLMLSIQDDGCGFILKEKGSIPHAGIGLIGMRERVNSLNGTMEIITSPEKGTKIEIQIPINIK